MHFMNNNTALTREIIAKLDDMFLMKKSTPPTVSEEK